MSADEADAASRPPTDSDRIGRDGRSYRRLALRTHWVAPGDDLVELAHRYVDPVREPGDTLLISEKVLAVNLGGMIPADKLRPGGWQEPWRAPSARRRGRV